MNDILAKLIAGAKVTDSDIAAELTEICDRTHGSCDSDCPVYVKNGNAAPNTDPDGLDNGCDTFKHGTNMLAFLRK